MYRDLKAEFIRAVDAKTDREHLKMLDHNNDVSILMGGDPITNRLTLQAVRKLNDVQIEKKRKEFVDYVLQLSSQQILEHIRQIQEQILEAIKRMDDIINLADARIEYIQQSLQDLTGRHKELNDTIEARYFDKNADGTYKSKAIAYTIAAYEGRTGKKIPDDITPEMLIQILQAQMDFEKNVFVPELEHELVKLHEFRDGVQEQKETFEEENKRIDDALEAIDADTSLSDEERRLQKIEILKGASEIALDAQMAAHSVEQGYAEMVEETLLEKLDNDDIIYDSHVNGEDFEINQSALDDLKNIKPIVPFAP